jgi:uncharacterized protein YeaO (DUF488 family)
MPVLAKSIYESPTPEDGLRVLTTNYWPRGIAKSKVDLYKRILSPNRDALRAYKASEVAWPDYAKQYLELMQGDEQQREIAELAALADMQPITILCICKDDTECHRRLLRELIEAAMKVPA